MKSILSVLCLITIAVLITSCDNGSSGGTSGGRGDYPQATYDIGSGNTVTCFNVDSNVKTNDNRYDCTWNCAIYLGVGPRKVMLTFSDVATCAEYEKDALGNDTNVCMTEGDPEFMLSNERFSVCAQ